MGIDQLVRIVLAAAQFSDFKVGMVKALTKELEAELYALNIADQTSPPDEMSAGPIAGRRTELEALLHRLAGLVH